MIPLAPPALLALVAAKRGGSALPKDLTRHGNEPGWVEELMKGAEHGAIDDSMAKLAGHFVAKGLPIAQVIDIVDSGFGSRCTKGGRPFKVPMSDVRRVVESVHRGELAKRSASTVDESEFHLLGYDHDRYFYFSKATGQVVRLSAREHDKNNLLRIADLRYWEAKFPTDSGPHWAGAQAKLMAAQHRVGVFDPERIRGRGAWWDDSIGAAMHTGESLLAAGRSMPVRELARGRHIYELARPLDVSLGSPLGDDAAGGVLGLFESLSWEHPHHARLAAGWCVVAAICGAVSWRPHVWFSGPSGAGKSWVVDNLVRRLLGNLALVAQSETTEAGLRQSLGHDARPVIFDEAEADGARGDLRMANVLGLMRQASSETGGSILKGSSDGMARSYMIRSCFAMSSINVSAFQAADRNRITVLELKIDQDLTQEQREERFRSIRAAVARVLTDEACAGFRSRCIAMIPTIRANAQAFATIAASKIGSRRLGDQVGTLLAGAYSLLDSGAVDAEHAEALIDEQDLAPQKDLQLSSDERELMDCLLQHVVRVQVSRGQVDRSIATLLKAAHGGLDSEVSADAAALALSLVGVKVLDEGFVVANSHKGIRKVLEGSHWSKDWGRVLKRINGSKVSGVVRIGDVACRGTLVPWDAAD